MIYYAPRYGNLTMKIKGFYILTRRSIARMIKAIATAFGTLCISTCSIGDMLLTSRYANTTQSLLSLKCSLKCDAARTVVPDLLYLEGKTLYFKAKRYVAARSANAPYQTDATASCPPGAARRDASPYQTDATPKRRNSRRGSGLKGKRTERMVEQLADFTAWLRGNPINERDPARTVGARASLFWRLHEKTFKRDAVRVGEKRGFGSEKTLAAAFRNSKPKFVISFSMHSVIYHAEAQRGRVLRDYVA